MKKNDWILLCAVFLYSYLFYNQFPGINFLIFSFALVAMVIVKDRALLSVSTFRLAAAGCLLTGICVAWHGSILSTMANVISLGLLSSFSINRESSVVVALFHSAYSSFTAILFMAFDAMQRKARAAKAEKTGSKFILWLIPVLVTFIFFFLYRTSSPLFNEMVRQINFDFIYLDLLMFTTFGFVLMYGYFYPKSIGFVINIEKAEGNEITPGIDEENKILGTPYDIRNENYSGVVLFTLLNLLLLIVNALDFNFIFLGYVPNASMSYSVILHQGVETLIVSIITAIALILFYFRGQINFYRDNKKIKILACIWVAQNIFMIAANAYRNHLYIEEYSLTFKRIGVYVWLLLALIGLIITFIKIRKVKSNWFLIRKTSWMFYSVLVISCFVNWSQLVTSFNISRAIEYQKPLDAHYLLELSDSNIPQLLDLSQNPGIHIQQEVIGARDFNEELKEKISEFSTRYTSGGWQSWNIDDALVHRSLDHSGLAVRESYRETSPR